MTQRYRTKNSDDELPENYKNRRGDKRYLKLIKNLNFTRELASEILGL